MAYYVTTVLNMRAPGVDFEDYLCLSGYTSYCGFIAIIFACSCWSYYYASHRPQFQYHLFRSGRGRRPHFVPALVLILWSPRGLYPNSSWLWDRVSDLSKLLGEEASIWLSWYGLRDGFNWCLGFYRLSPSHVYCWHGRGH